uniref:Uncharacterized protein n=1 Tax=Strigamia maritima TaxID=126957 RepID=T1IWY5_STRMM
MALPRFSNVATAQKDLNVGRDLNIAKDNLAIGRNARVEQSKRKPKDPSASDQPMTDSSSDEGGIQYSLARSGNKLADLINQIKSDVNFIEDVDKAIFTDENDKEFSNKFLLHDGQKVYVMDINQQKPAKTYYDAPPPSGGVTTQIE